METLLISDPTDFSIAAHILQEGGLVAIPTETVYGLAGNGLNATAVSNIFIAKGRPSDNPLILHISNLEMLNPLVKAIPPTAKLLMQAFWPGPLTLIFEATDTVPSIVRAGLPSVAIRFPSHPIIQSIISLSGVPLAAPSANTSGKPSPTNACRVQEDLNGKIDAIIDGGSCEFGLESTVVDLTGDVPVILRPGAITYAMLTDVVAKVIIDPALTHHDTSLTPKAPGMKYTHYAPDAELIIVKGPLDRVIPEINHRLQEAKSKGLRTGVLGTDETLDSLHCDIKISLGSEMNLHQIAANLFEKLRIFDDLGVDIVYTLSFKEEGIGKAIMNRLEKSAGYHIIDVCE